MIHRLVFLFDTVRSQVRRHSYRPPRLFSVTRQRFPQGVSLKDADAGTRRLEQALTEGVSTKRGWCGRPSR